MKKIADSIVIIVDDENRENERDFVTADHNPTPGLIDFMATRGRGLICTPLDFIARLAALVPKHQVNLTRFHAVYTPLLQI